MDANGQSRVAHPWLITFSVILASFLYSIDWTIAVVALPHMQGTFSATQDQVAWVITSYIVASAIILPTSGWLSSRFGRKRIFSSAVVGFAVSSVFCGAANSLEVEVFARIAQGMSGAFLVPLSLSIVLDTFPKKQHPLALSVWGLSWSGALIGPTLGGYLTEYYSWRYIFYINLPIGIIALIGVLLFLPETKKDKTLKLDWFGFLTLAVGIGYLQMMLDRGQRLDWFESGEIIFECCLAGVAFYMFNAHVMTRKNPFLDPRLFLERNFFLALVLVSFYGLLTVPPMVLMPTFLENLIGYQIDDVGLLQSSRGVGVILAMFAAGRMTGRVSLKIQISFGLLCLGISSGVMATWTAAVSAWPIVWTGFVSGIGAGILMVPTQVVAFSRVDAIKRNEAAAVFNLVRTMFSSIGISLILALFVYVSATGRTELVEHVSPFNPAITDLPTSSMSYSLNEWKGLKLLEKEIDRQSAVLGYNASFMILSILSFLAMPLVFLLGRVEDSTKTDGDDDIKDIVIPE